MHFKESKRDKSEKGLKENTRKLFLSRANIGRFQLSGKLKDKQIIKSMMLG